MLKGQYCIKALAIDRRDHPSSVVGNYKTTMKPDCKGLETVWLLYFYRYSYSYIERKSGAYILGVIAMPNKLVDPFIGLNRQTIQFFTLFAYSYVCIKKTM